MGQLANVPGGNYAKEFDLAFPGQIEGLGPRFVRSAANGDTVNIGFGYGLTAALSAALFGCVRLPKLNSQVINGSADLDSGASTVVTLNGTALTAVVYATSHAATMTALAAEIADQPGVLSATVTSARQITVVMANGDVAVTMVTTDGSGVTWTPVAATSTDTLAGIACYKPNGSTLPTPDTASVGIPFEPGDTVDVLESGIVVVQLATGVTVSAVVPAYIVVANTADRGKFTTSSAGGALRCGSFRPDLDPDGRFGASGGICPVELVNPRVAA